MIRSFERKEKTELLCEGGILGYEPVYITDKAATSEMLFQAF